jgi:hypothetical protein
MPERILRQRYVHGIQVVNDADRMVVCGERPHEQCSAGARTEGDSGERYCTRGTSLVAGQKEAS